MTTVPLDSSAGSLLLATQSPLNDNLQVRFRKGEKNDKDIFVEVWDDSVRGFISSRKISDKCTKIYNDAIFGGVSWSRDCNRITFIGEKPEPPAFKNYWEDEQPIPAAKTEEEEKKAEESKKEEEKKKPEDLYLDKKYLF